MTAAPLVEIDRLHISFPGPNGPVAVVDGVSLSVQAGERLALVGESGSGKSMTALAMLGLLPPGGQVSGGRIVLGGRDLASLAPAGWRELRGGRVGMVFQDPMTSLNPVRTIGSLLEESIRRHRGGTRADTRARAVAALRDVGIPSPEQRLDAYPHQLSGGLRQRCVIALALVNNPEVVLADEPTTALDATTQAQVLDLLRRRTEGRALLLITHDLGVAAELTDRVAAMYSGRLVETGPTRAVLEAPRHPYTAALLAAVPRFGARGQRLRPIGGSPPHPADRPKGCAFAPRCERATALCQQAPLMAAEAHAVACHSPLGQGGAA